MTRRDFVKCLGLAIAAFHAHASPSQEKKKPALKKIKPTAWWTLEGNEQVREFKDEYGNMRGAISHGWKIRLTKTTRCCDGSDPEPLIAVTLASLQSEFGLPADLAHNLKILGFDKFIAHERRVNMSHTQYPVLEQDWVAWQDPETMELLSTPIP